MFKELRTSLTLFLLFLLLTGLIYPLAVLGIGHALFPVEANGSLIEDNGKIIGSTLIGQSFTGDVYFHGRPSYAGSGYDAANSAGSNLAATNPVLLQAVRDRVAALKAASNSLALVPVDSVTASGSGLDPHISVAGAQLQIARVAAARHQSLLQIKTVVNRYTELRTFGILGENRINVLKLNRALDESTLLKPQAPPHG